MKSGYDVQAITANFTQLGWDDAKKTVPFWGKGTGKLMVDYIKTSEDFWSIVNDRLPIAIMSFSRGRPGKEWLIEKARNLEQKNWDLDLPWFNNAGVEQKPIILTAPRAGGSANDFSPYKGQGAIAGNPPDPTQAARMQRNSNLPNDAIVKAIQMQFPNPPGIILPANNKVANADGFVSEYMAYHVAWYRDYSKAKYARPC